MPTPVEALKNKPPSTNREILPDIGVIIASAIAAVGLLRQKELNLTAKEKPSTVGMIDISKQSAHNKINLEEGPICGAICPHCYSYCTIRDAKHSQHTCGQHSW